jgi:cytoskeletal protein CcmA (bactofilin family)
MFLNSKDEKKQVVKTVKEYQIDTLISTSASIKGDIISEGNIRLDGNFNGTITSKNEVLIGEKASMTGTITAKTIIIYGTVNGNIESDGLSEIMSTGKLYGDIVAKSISIKEGAIFQGKSSMLENSEESYIKEVFVDKVIQI